VNAVVSGISRPQLKCPKKLFISAQNGQKTFFVSVIDLDVNWRPPVASVYVQQGSLSVTQGKKYLCVARSNGYKLQVTCYKLHVTSYMLQVTCYKLHVTSYKLQVKYFCNLCVEKLKESILNFLFFPKVNRNCNVLLHNFSALK
jgi:hypothetical protein